MTGCARGPGLWDGFALLQALPFQSHVSLEMPPGICLLTPPYSNTDRVDRSKQIPADENTEGVLEDDFLVQVLPSQVQVSGTEATPQPNTTTTYRASSNEAPG